MDVFDVLKQGKRARPIGLQTGTVACLDPPTDDTISGVVEQCPVGMEFLLVGTNDMGVWTTHVHAKTLEKVFSVTTSPFDDDEGCI